MEKKKRNLNGLQIRMLVSALIFLLFFALNQVSETNDVLKSLKIMERLESFEDIYRLEDACIVWYNQIVNK